MIDSMKRTMNYQEKALSIHIDDTIDDLQENAKKPVEKRPLSRNNNTPNSLSRSEIIFRVRKGKADVENLKTCAGEKTPARKIGS